MEEPWQSSWKLHLRIEQMQKDERSRKMWSIKTCQPTNIWFEKQSWGFSRITHKTDKEAWLEPLLGDNIQTISLPTPIGRMLKHVLACSVPEGITAATYWDLTKKCSELQYLWCVGSFLLQMEYKSIPARAHRPELRAKFDFRKELALPERLQVHRAKDLPSLKVLIKVSCKQTVCSTLIVCCWKINAY